jgi:hypothetical protein
LEAEMQKSARTKSIYQTEKKKGCYALEDSSEGGRFRHTTWILADFPLSLGVIKRVGV